MYAEIEAHKLLNIKELIFKMGSARSACADQCCHDGVSQFTINSLSLLGSYGQEQIAASRSLHIEGF